MKKTVYLDYAAATPLDPTVLAAMQPHLTERFYNPSATYLAALEVGQELEGARRRVAHHLGARQNEIIFTAGGTEANNLAIRGVLEQFPDGNMVASSIEHESVLAPAHVFSCREVTVASEGIVDPQAIAQLIDERTVLVSVMYANNEIGSVQPIRRIAALLEAIRRARQAAGNDRPLYFHTDAAQAANYLDLHVSRLGVDMMTLNAGKIYGPKQSGCLFASARVRLAPQILGGGQERGQRSGTENVAGAVGFAAALELAQSQRAEESARLKTLQNLFFDLLPKHIPQTIVNGSRKNRLPNNVHITIPGADNERLLMQLDEAGIQCAAGSACSASNEESSHVLRAMGIPDADARASLRFTMGRQTTESDVPHAVATLTSLL